MAVDLQRADKGISILTMTSKSAIHILTLLAETRLLIYKHYIHGMNAFLIKSIEQDTRLGGQDPSFEVRFKITLGDHEAPACDLELSRVCRNIRHELLPWLAANAGLEVMAKGDFPMMHPDMSVLPRWYAVGVRRVTFTDAETIRYCLLPLPSLHNVIIRLLNEEELKGFKKGVPRTRVALKDKELRNAVWQQTYEKFRAERERSFPYIQDQDFKLTVAVGFGRVTVLLAGKELIEGVSLNVNAKRTRRGKPNMECTWQFPKRMQSFGHILLKVFSGVTLTNENEQPAMRHRREDVP